MRPANEKRAGFEKPTLGQVKMIMSKIKYTAFWRRQQALICNHFTPNRPTVIPAKAGIQSKQRSLKISGYALSRV
jgi:hypothetical protein